MVHMYILDLDTHIDSERVRIQPIKLKDLRLMVHVIHY